jgi:hypothetical protein
MCEGVKNIWLGFNKIIAMPLRHAYGVGDPLRDYREVKIFIFFDFKI